MNNLYKLASLSLGLIAAGCSGSGGGGGGASPVTRAPVSLAATGGTAVGASSSTTASINEISSTRSSVTIGGRSYSVSQSAPGVQTNSANTFAYVPSSSFSGIRSGRHVDTGFYVQGSNLFTPTERVSNVGAIIDGNLTPVQNLPAVAVYRGTWNGAIIENNQVSAIGGGGNFTATADFGPRQEVTGTLRDGASTLFNIDADINGNEFSGTLNSSTNQPVLPVQGGFFGPNAEEIAGAAAGSINGAQVGVSFIGNR